MNYSYISCQRSLLVIYFNSVLCFVFMTEDTCDKDGFYLDRNKLNCNFLHPHLSVLNIVLHRIHNLLRIGDSQNFEARIPELLIFASIMKTITVVAAVIRNSRGEIFVTQRGYGEFKDWWELPGGKAEPGETLEQALKREIREELDTEISVDSFITTIDYDYPSFHLTMHCYWCSILSGNLELKEHEAAKWLAPDELESVNWLPADLILLPFLR